MMLLLTETFRIDILLTETFRIDIIINATCSLVKLRTTPLRRHVVAQANRRLLLRIPSMQVILIYYFKITGTRVITRKGPYPYKVSHVYCLHSIWLSVRS